MKTNQSKGSGLTSKKLMLSMILTTGLNLSNASAQQGLQPPPVGPQLPQHGPGGHLIPGAPVVKPPQEAKKTLQKHELEQMAKSAAQRFIQDAINTYMPTYRFRYNLRKGLLAANAQHGQKITEEFNKGSKVGEAEGQNQGIARGQADSERLSKQMIEGDIGREVDEAIQNNGLVSFIQNPRPYEGNYSVSVSLNTPESIVSRINKDKDYQAEMAEMFAYTQGQQLQQHLVKTLLSDVANVMNTEMLSLPVQLQGENVFALWERRELPSSHVGHGDFEGYLRITNPNLYENAVTNKEEFRRTFIWTVRFGSQFNPTVESLDSHWSKLITSNNLLAESLGKRYYKLHTEKFSYESGYNSGFTKLYGSWAVNEFNENFEKDYTKQYSGLETKTRTSSLITSVQAQIVSSDNKTEFTAGDEFDIVVYGAANRGMKSAVIPVKFMNQDQALALKNGAKFQLDGFRKLQTPLHFRKMGKITDQTEPYQTMTLQAQVDDDYFSVQVRLTFEELMRRVGSSQDPAEIKHLMTKVEQWMKEEWDKSSGVNDQFVNKDEGKLFIKLYYMFTRNLLTDEQKAGIRAQAQYLYNAHGPKPKKFLGMNPKRDEWNAVHSMMEKEMGMTGVTPN